jgi:hypothetical protein
MLRSDAKKLIDDVWHGQCSLIHDTVPIDYGSVDGQISYGKIASVSRLLPCEVCDVLDFSYRLPLRATVAAGERQLVVPVEVTLHATLNTAGKQSLTATDSANASITGTQANITVAPAGLTALGRLPLDDGGREPDHHRRSQSVSSAGSSGLRYSPVHEASSLPSGDELRRLKQLARVKHVRIRARHPNLIIPKRRPARHPNLIIPKRRPAR